jgi:type I restriction enzyme S subunit
MPLGEVLARSEEWIDLEPDEHYRQVTVRLWGKGVVQRDRVTGAEIAATRRLAARANQFILSRIDARNGAFGLVPPALDGAVVSNDFPTFTINSARLLPEFLDWMSKTQSFIDLCRAASEGTTNRVRLAEARFLQMTIPLPPLAEQRRIVARVEALAAKVEEARGLRRQAAEEARQLVQALQDEAYFALSTDFGQVALEEVCCSITDGDHQTPTFMSHGVKFIFVGNVSSGHLHFDGCKFVSREYYDSLRSHRKPAQGDILYSAVGATLGIPAIVDREAEFCFQRHVAIIKPNRAVLSSRFLWHMLRSRTLFARAWAETTGSAQPTVPLRAIKSFPIPLPPLIQQDIVASDLDIKQGRIETLNNHQAKATTELDALLPAILDRAFRGEL